MQTVPSDEAGELINDRTVSDGRRVRMIGMACVMLTALGWGLNWPATKFLLAICPPLSARGVSGLTAGGILFLVAALLGESLAVPRALWGRLAMAAVLNVSAWMGLTTVSLMWLPAGQAATLAYTMPVWATLLAWPMLGERPAPRQVGAIVLGTCGVVILVGGAIFQFDAARLPGVVIALSAAGLFAFGTVLSKRMPIPLPRVALTAWQVFAWVHPAADRRIAVRENGFCGLAGDRVACPGLHGVRVDGRLLPAVVRRGTPPDGFQRRDRHPADPGDWRGRIHSRVG